MYKLRSIPKIQQGIPICTLCGAMLLCALPACAPYGPGAQMDIAADTEAITELLMNQQNDWNAGDIEAFMQGYVHSDSLRFASGGTYRFGWDATIERYYDTYPDRDAMGTLVFSNLDIDILSNGWAMAFGAWHLTRGGDYEDIGGLFTLILRRDAQGWRIMYDHTSRAVRT